MTLGHLEWTQSGVGTIISMVELQKTYHRRSRPCTQKSKLCSSIKVATQQTANSQQKATNSGVMTAQMTAQLRRELLKPVWRNVLDLPRWLLVLSTDSLMVKMAKVVIARQLVLIPSRVVMTMSTTGSICPSSMVELQNTYHHFSRPCTRKSKLCSSIMVATQQTANSQQPTPS